MRYQRTTSRGYTLLEMIVSVGIFSVVMLAATGAYLKLIDLDRQARATNDVVSNLSFAVDSMSRAVRTGTAYKCNNSSGTPNCPSTPGNSFGFTDSESPNRTVIYTLVNGQIIATINGVASALTDPRINVQTLKFYVRGVGTGEGAGVKIQPQVTFTIGGRIRLGSNSNASTTISIQGGATERLLEIP